MAILGLSGSPKKGGNVDRMVQALLDQSGKEHEFVNLSRLKFDPCRGCCHLCAPERICQIRDDLHEWLPRIRDAEAIVLGTPFQMGMPTGFMFNFITRLEGFHHVDPALFEKPAVLVSSGLKSHELQLKDGIPWFESMVSHSRQMKILGHIYFHSEAAPCFRCGEGQHCLMGGYFRYVLGSDREKLDNTVMSTDLVRNWEDCPEMVDEIAHWGSKLRDM
jgi:multimeric flavodoxin WrbA